MKYSISRISAELGIDRVSRPDYEGSLLLTDSRSLIYPSESLFLSRYARVNNDGHRYIEELYGKGVRNFVVERVPDSLEGCCRCQLPCGGRCQECVTDDCLPSP